MSSLLAALRSWVDTSTPQSLTGSPRQHVHWARIAPFVLLHVGCLGVFWVGWSPFAVCFAIGFYLLRAFFITGFYHRYFSHRAFKTSRWMQFVMATLGNSAVQRGPLWWAAHHRQHHADSDGESDPHSPRVHGLYWGHMGWLTSQKNFPTDYKWIPDLARYPELRWLDRLDTLIPTLMAGALFGLGSLLALLAPGLGTNGPQLLIWGFFVSTTLLFHVTCLVNSAAHLCGRRRFKTTDDSRNSLWVALLTLGEGWHNNHHHYPGAARAGFYPWEIDVTYYLLKLMSWCGLIWELAPIPKHVLERNRVEP